MSKQFIFLVAFFLLMLCFVSASFETVDYHGLEVGVESSVLIPYKFGKASAYITNNSGEEYCILAKEIFGSSNLAFNFITEFEREYTTVDDVTETCSSTLIDSKTSQIDLTKCVINNKTFNCDKLVEDKGDYYCSFTVVSDKKNVTTIEKLDDVSELICFSDKETKWFNLYFEVPFNSTGKFSWFVVDPIWATNNRTLDFNSGTGFDYNYAKITFDGNVMATGQIDFNVFKSYPADLDQNLRIFLNYDDGNATHFYNSGNFNCDFLYKGTDINLAGQGLWDTNSIFYSDKNYSYCTSSGIRNLFYNKPITISGWVNPKKITSNVIPILGINYGATSLIYVGVSPSTGKFYPRIGHNNGGIVGTFPEVPINQWSYIAGVITPSPTYPTGTGNAKIYLNGILIFNGDFNMMYNEINDPLSVYQNYFGGAMGNIEYDSIKFWDRALNQQEIVADYNGWLRASYKSSIFDSNSLITDWNSLIFYSDTNSQINNIKLQFRSSKFSDCNDGVFVGGQTFSSTDYFDSDANFHLLGSFFDNNQYGQFIAYFDQNSTLQSNYINYAYLKDVNISYIIASNSSPDVNEKISPLNYFYYNNEIDVNFSIEDPNGDTLVCDFYLHDENLSVDINFGVGQPVYSNICGVKLDSTKYFDGNYYINFRVRESSTTEKYFADFNMIVPFYIDNSPPRTTLFGLATATTSTNITFSCVDDSNGCFKTFYHLDADSNSSNTWIGELQEPLTDSSLLAYYTFNASDLNADNWIVNKSSTGSIFDLNLTSFATPITSIPDLNANFGKWKNKGSINVGEDGRILTTGITDKTSYHQITGSVWASVYTTNVNNSSVLTDSSNSTINWDLLITNTGNPALVVIDSVSGIVSCVSPTALTNPNYFYNLAFSIDYDNDIQKLYVDGVLVAECSYDAVLSANTLFSVGNEVLTGNTELYGNVADIKIWNRILSAQEIVADANAFIPYSSALNYGVGDWGLEYYSIDGLDNKEGVHSANIIVSTQQTFGGGGTSGGYVFPIFKIDLNYSVSKYGSDYYFLLDVNKNGFSVDANNITLRVSNLDENLYTLYIDYSFNSFEKIGLGKYRLKLSELAENNKFELKVFVDNSEEVKNFYVQKQGIPEFSITEMVSPVSKSFYEKIGSLLFDFWWLWALIVVLTIIFLFARRN